MKPPRGQAAAAASFGWPEQHGPKARFDQSFGPERFDFDEEDSDHAGRETFVGDQRRERG